MTDEATTERKLCPQCGHSNRVTAKVCTQCGFAFFLVRENGNLRKRCLHCNWLNRVGAKVCSHCGSSFRGITMVSRGTIQQWCPQCGQKRKGNAKVCSQCGHRFKLTPVEPPIVQSDGLAEPAKPPAPVRPVVPPKPTPKSTPASANFGGEPAPYLTEAELERLRRVGTVRRDLFVRLFDLVKRS